MVNLLARLLGPIFTGMGVSEADLLSYLTQLQGYVYAILAALVVMIIVLIAASKAKKGFKHVVRWQAVRSAIIRRRCCLNIRMTASRIWRIPQALCSVRMEQALQFHGMKWKIICIW